MILRHGFYTVYNTFVFELYPDGIEKFQLVFRGEECPFNDFLFQGFDAKGKRVFSKIFNKSDINNSFYVANRCTHKSFDFALINVKGDYFLLRTEDHRVAYLLDFEMVDRGVYEKYIHRSEIERMWEVRSIASYDLPMPEGLKEIEEIEY